MPTSISRLYPAGFVRLYKYTPDLLCLGFLRPQTTMPIPQDMAAVSTPLVIGEWRRALQSHPDQAFAMYICEGLQFGFRIGFDRSTPLQSVASNMPSALQHPAVITEYLEKERRLGRMLGPYEAAQVTVPLHINRFGVIPKGRNTGKWRLITDLSHPPGHSVNDGIDPDLCSLSYTTVDEIAELITQFSAGALLAKIDIESAYRLIPVHPQDRLLQAMQWEGRLYVDPMLPFGLRSAPKIFNAVADALNWHLHECGLPQVRHYLDDFIIIAPPDSPQCQEALSTLERECVRLGVPLADHKKDGPTTCLTFLGIEIDTLAGILRLPQGKLQRLQVLLAEWGDRKSCSRKELESLIGLLNHACKVVRPGRSFRRRMIDLLHEVQRPCRSRLPIRLNVAFRSDLAWWRTFIESWNGVSFLPPPAGLPTMHLTSDASGSWGCGAWHQQSWFQCQWDARAQHLTIVEKELIPIVLAGATWGHKWQGHQVVCHCDNQAVIAGLRSRSSRHKGVMHLLRCLVFVEAHLGFYFQPAYINTKANHLADDLSRNNLSSFLSKVPEANPQPTPLPVPLLDLLLDKRADWISPLWSHRFRATFRRD